MRNLMKYICCCCCQKDVEDDDVYTPLIPDVDTLPCDAPLSGNPRNVVVRKPYNKLSKDEKKRFFTAIDGMLVSRQDGEPMYFSPYFQIASYNKWPMHLSTDIPKSMMGLWYRAYLEEFEKALQISDIQLGGDGKIGLPYINVETDCAIPQEIREFRFPVEYMQANEELANAMKKIPRDIDIKSSVSRLPLSGKGSPETIDEIAGKIIDAFGFTTNNFAAFNPAFYMVLCYIDMLYDKHGSKFRFDSLAPKTLDYWKILVPFKKLPMDLIDIEQLGYKYE